MTGVFLSASFPSGDRGDAVTPYYPADIASAAAAVAEGVLRSAATLIFGGHPTISPIVLQIASLLDAGDRVTIFQSEHFANQITDEVQRLAQVEGATIRFTPAGSTLSESLEVMRLAMFGEELRAAFFIGGMAGIRDEFQMLDERRSDTARFVMEEPGGMAARIALELPGVERVDTVFTGEIWQTSRPRTFVLGGRAYASLVLRALHQVDLQRPEDLGDEV